MIRHRLPRGTSIAALLLLALVVWAPVLFGSVLPRERLVLELLAFAAFAAALGSTPTWEAGGRGAAAWRGAAAPSLAILGVGLFGLAQSLPWPPAVARLVAPTTAQAWQAARQLLADGARDVHNGAIPLDGIPLGGIPLTFSPPVSREVSILWLAAAAALAAAAVVSGERRLRRLMLPGLVAVAVFEIVYGAERWFARSSVIWGRHAGAGGGRLRGTFVNPDHLATFLIFPLVMSFAWAWWSLRRLRQSRRLEHRLFYLTAPWLAFLTFFVGLAFTGSRGGLVAAAVAIVLMTLLLALHYRRWQVGILGVAAFAVGAGGIFYFGLQRGLGRFLDTSIYEITWNTRLEVYGLTLELWRHFPWTGSGLGTFRQAFPLVQPAELSMTWIHAHSDVLELLATTGLAGTALLALAVVPLARQLWRGLQRGRRSEDRATALMAFGALAGALAHSTVDFGLSIPSNGMLLAVLVGLGCGVPLRPRKTP